MMWRAIRVLVFVLLGAGTAGLAQTGPVRLRVDPSASRIYVVTHKSGLFSFLGHEHAILAPTWSAELCWDAAAGSGASAKIKVDARELVIDSDEARSLAGLGGGPSPKQRDEIQQKLLDPKRLAVDQHPELSFETTGVTPADQKTWNLRGRLTIKGVTREVEFPATIEAGSNLRMTAKFTVRQSNFDIKPESIAGVVKVSDPVDVHIAITAAPTNEACAR